jgi:ABC-type Fe3+-hydroxamate transport system substrate-binding protein
MLSRSFTDQLGNVISLPYPPKRIVSLVPSQTELLYDLGLRDEVVGVTKFCIHPELWQQEKKIIGGTKKFHFHEIEKLQPDLIIGNKEENYQEGIEILQKKFPVWMSDIVSMDDALEMIAFVGEMVSKKEVATNLVASIKNGFDQLNRFKKRSALYLIWRNPWMAVGENTFIHVMLEYAGFKNCITDTRYPELSNETITSCNPDVVLLSSEPYPFQQKHIKEISQLCPHAKVKLVDGELFSWYGSRLLKAPAYFTQLQSQL